MQTPPTSPITSITSITDGDLCLSLRSTICPACGGPKKSRQTFCGRDYFALSRTARAALYRRLGDGYREAVAGAMESLGAATFRLGPRKDAPRHA